MSIVIRVSFWVHSYFLDLTNIFLDSGTSKLFWIPTLPYCLFSKRKSRKLDVKLEFFIIYYVINAPDIYVAGTPDFYEPF